MSSPKRFHEFALECMHRAEEAHDERKRQALLGMAAHWMRAAARAPRLSMGRVETRYSFGTRRNAARLRAL
jgi:hypothetical protein